MSSDKDIVQRVQNGLWHLQKGLTPFVEGRLKAAYGANWSAYVSRAAGAPESGPLDVYAQLKTMIDRWREAFEMAFARNDKHRARTFVSTAFEARNATSHLSLPLQDDDALRYLDAMVNLMRMTKADEAETAEVKKLYEAQRRAGLDPAAPPAPAAEASTPATEPQPTGSRAAALQPWYKVALPHPDVIANRFQQAEFAADLHSVDTGKSSENYATPSAFFGITFVTEGLRRILTAAVERLSGAGGDPVVGLQTAFGGGKTHTMLALYHLARHLQTGGAPSALPGLDKLTDWSALPALPRPKLAVFVGSGYGPDVSLRLDGGPKVQTVWGYIAWRLAGEAGVELMHDAEKAGTNPGSELLVELFRLSGPALILLDELTMFARQLSGERFEAFLSFIQSLTEAAKMAPGVLVVGSLPESMAEAGGERGQEALTRLEKIFGRVESAWLPAQGDETYEIVRRRLFQPLDSEGEAARDAAVRAFHDMYKANAAEFPPEAKEARYRDLLKIAYPIHPELFERLSKDWSTLPKFQRTRGVLRFMANVIGVLWQERPSDLLITPARIPIAHEKVRTSLLYALDPQFAGVVDKEVDGVGALPAKMERNPTRRMAQARAATRAARAIFICSAPLAGQHNVGVNIHGLRLACAEPSDQLAIFGEAVREMLEGSAFLYEEAGRYWFSTKPTLNQLAKDRAASLADHVVDAEIVAILTQDAKSAGGFARVFAAPDDPVGIEEAQAASLVILPPACGHSGKGATKSAATEMIAETLTRRGSTQRKFRNTLIFSAPDDALLATAREAVRKSLAWRQITADAPTMQGQLTGEQAESARQSARNHAEGAQKAVRAAWKHMFHPMRSSQPGQGFELDHAFVTAPDRAALPLTLYEKAKAESVILEKMGRERFWLEIGPLWPTGADHLAIEEIVDWFRTFVYLPKLRDRVVLDMAIADALAQTDPPFAYAEAHGPSGYVGLSIGRAPPQPFPDAAMLVTLAAAQKQLDAQQPKPAAGPYSAAPGPTLHAPDPSARPAQQAGGTTGPAPAPARPRRFYGSVEINLTRPLKNFEGVLNDVIRQLENVEGTRLTLTLDIEAINVEGFSEDDVGVVRDNARALKFRPESTGFSD